VTDFVPSISEKLLEFANTFEQKPWGTDLRVIASHRLPCKLVGFRSLNG
jgi:hypothetical protein